MRVLWLCALTNPPGKANYWHPVILDVLSALGDLPVIEWVTMDGNNTNPFAIGVAELDTIQQTAVELDARVAILIESEWKGQWSDALLTRRVRWGFILTTLNETTPQGADSVQDTMNVIIDRLGPTKSLAYLADRVLARQGVG